MVIREVVQRSLDEASWNINHWRLFWIVSASFLLEGVLFSVVPATLYIVAPDTALYVLATNSLFFMIGAVFLGRLADLFGRRVLLITSLLIYLVGTILFLFLHSDFIQITVTTSLINLGVGGEVGAAYAALAELIPARHRGKSIMLAANFWNIGAAFIAGLALLYMEIYSDINTQLRSLLITAIALALVVAFARLHIPESPRWLIERGRFEEAKEIIKRFTGLEIKDLEKLGGVLEEHYLGLKQIFSSRKYLFRFLTLVILTFTQLLTYNMIAYYMPYSRDFIYGSEAAPTVIFISNLGASIGAFIMIPLIDKSRRLSTSFSYLGGLLTASVIAYTYIYVGDLRIFLFIILINMIFAEWAWASLSSLESELFPTGVRASVVGLNTGLAWIINTLIILLEAMITATQYLYTTIILWLVGFVASMIWYLRGVETARKPLELIH
ncbi:MAG: MFS transporter [Sulfolobales archaeon]